MGYAGRVVGKPRTAFVALLEVDKLAAAAVEGCTKTCSTMEPFFKKEWLGGESSVDTHIGGMLQQDTVLSFIIAPFFASVELFQSSVMCFN